MNYPKSKSEIVNLIMSEMKDNPDSLWKNTPVDRLMFQWFATGRSGSGLRLTNAGASAFDSVNIAYYDFDFTVPEHLKGNIDWGNKYILRLNEKIKCPYYLGVRKEGGVYIRVYDHRIAMLMTIYGTLENYVESLG